MKQEATAEGTVKRGRDEEILPRAATHGENRQGLALLPQQSADWTPQRQRICRCRNSWLQGPPQSLGKRTEVPEHGKAHLELLEPEEQRRQKGVEGGWRSK